MRQIINISLPPAFLKIVNTEMKENHFSSKSEFFRHLLREWHTARLLKDIEKGRAEHKAGKTKIVKSSKDLWN